MGIVRSGGCDPLTLFDILKDALITPRWTSSRGRGALANLVQNVETLFRQSRQFGGASRFSAQIVEAIIGIPGDLAPCRVGHRCVDRWSPLFSGNLFGQIGAGIIGLIPGARVAGQPKPVARRRHRCTVASLGGRRGVGPGTAPAATCFNGARVTYNSVAKGSVLRSDSRCEGPCSGRLGLGVVVQSDAHRRDSPDRLNLAVPEHRNIDVAQTIP